MSILKIKAFSIDTADTFTFANANITSNLVAGNANVSGVINVTGNLTAGNVFATQIGNATTYLYGDGSNITNISATTAKKLANGTSNVDITTSGGNVTIGVAGNAAIATFTGTGANISGYANITGNIVAGNVNAGNLLTANYISGTLTTAAQANITSVGTLSGLTVNGDITSTGNLIVAGTTTYVNSTNTTLKDPIIEQGGGANGAALSSDDGMDRGQLLHYYTGGATRDAFMGWKNSTGEFTFASNASVATNVVTVNALGNIKAGNANLGNLVTANYTTAVLTTAAQPNITSVGTLSGVTATGVVDLTGASNVSLGAIGNVKVTGGSSGQYLQTDGTGNLTWASISTGSLSNGTSNIQVLSSGNITLSSAGNANIAVITGTGVNVAGYLTSTGNITGANANLGNAVTANYFIGSGANLTSIAGANVTGAVGLATYASTANAVAGGNVSGQVGNALVAGTVYTAAQPNITSVGTLTSLAVTGNVTAGNANVTGQLISTIATGTSPLVVTSTTQVANLNAATAGTAATVTTNAQPNITSVGTLTSLIVGNATANSTFGNGTITLSSTGNLTGGNLVSATYLTGTLTTTAQPNITSVGTLSSLSVSGVISVSDVGNLYIPGGTNGYVLKTNGSGVLSWGAASAGTGNANISGSNTQLFFNDAGSNTLGASANLTFNKSTNTLTTTNMVVGGTTNLGAVGNVTITGGSANYLLKTDGSGSLSWFNPTYTTVGADGFTGDGTQTAFTLTTTPTNANYTIVSVGGVVQPKTTYSVSGATLTFSSAPPSTAPIEVTTINTGITAVSGGGGGGTGLTYQGISTNTTLVAGNSYIVNTSSANLTLTLPASSTLGDLIGIVDGTGTASSHALTITGANIMGSSSDMVITTNSAAFQIVYYNSTRGWVLTNV
jgi:hypothetical protein